MSYLDRVTAQGPKRRLMTYVRCCTELTRRGLDELGLPDLHPPEVQRLDSVDRIGDLQRVGRRYAAAHLDGFLTR